MPVKQLFCAYCIGNHDFPAVYTRETYPAVSVPAASVPAAPLPAASVPAVSAPSFGLVSFCGQQICSAICFSLPCFPASSCSCPSLSFPLWHFSRHFLVLPHSLPLFHASSGCFVWLLRQPFVQYALFYALYVRFMCAVYALYARILQPLWCLRNTSRTGLQPVWCGNMLRFRGFCIGFASHIPGQMPMCMPGCPVYLPVCLAVCLHRNFTTGNNAIKLLLACICIIMLEVEIWTFI